VANIKGFTVAIIANTTHHVKDVAGSSTLTLICVLWVCYYIQAEQYPLQVCWGDCDAYKSKMAYHWHSQSRHWWQCIHMLCNEIEILQNKHVSKSLFVFALLVECLVIDEFLSQFC
jgi:hypothetical protein